MATQVLYPDGYVFTLVLLSGAYTAIDDDADTSASDADYLSSTGTGTTSLYASFQAPVSNPTTGTGVQNFRFRARLTANAPKSLNWELRETGGFVRQSGTVSIASTSWATYTVAWDAANLSDADGAEVQFYLSGGFGGTPPSSRWSWEISALEWNVTYAAAGAALAGTAQAVASASGTLSTQIPLAGAAQAVASASGTLSTQIPLAGAALVYASASGELAAQGLTFLGAVGTCHAGLGTDPLLPPLELDLTSLGLQEGDLVWSAMALASTTNRDMTPALTDGWTPGTELYANDTWDTNTHCQYRVMGATPDDFVNYVYTYPTAAVGCVALAFRPPAGATITIDAAAATTGLNSGNANPPAATATADGFSIVCGAAAFSSAFSGNFSSLSSGYTAAYSGSAAGTDQHLKLAAAYAPAAAGTIDPGAFAVASDNTGASWASYHYLITAAVDGAAQLAGTAQAVASASGALSTQIPLAGAAAALTAADGTLTTEIRLSGAALAQALATAGLSTAITLSGSAAGLSTAAGLLSTQIPLAGAAIAQALASGTLDTSAAALAGAASATATASGTLSTAIQLAGAALASASASGTFEAPAAQLAGAALAQAAASGSLTTGIPLAGTASAQATAAAVLSTAIRLTGAAAAQATAAGSLDAGALLAGAAAALALASGTLSTQIRLAGAAYGQATASGTLTIALPLSGAALAQALASGTLTTEVRLSGAALAQAAASGALTTGIRLSGGALASAQATGTRWAVPPVLSGQVLRARPRVRRISAWAAAAGWDLRTPPRNHH